MLSSIRYGLLLVVFCFLAGCTDAPRARRVLEDQGYSNVTITGYRWWGCADDDSCATGFEAIAPGGKKVKGVVCSGFGLFSKGATVRLD